MSSFLNSNALQTIVTAAVGAGAIWIGYVQNTINKRLRDSAESSEIFAYSNANRLVDQVGNTIKHEPVVFVQNIGESPMFIQKYIFSGKEVKLDGQVLAPAKVNPNAHYWIMLPENGQTSVYIDFFFSDCNGVVWKSRIDAVVSSDRWIAKSSKRERVS